MDPVSKKEKEARRAEWTNVGETKPSKREAWLIDAIAQANERARRKADHVLISHTIHGYPGGAERDEIHFWEGQPGHAYTTLEGPMRQRFNFTEEDWKHEDSAMYALVDRLMRR